MKKSYFKNKGFILLQVILISFLFLSLTLIIQLLLDSRFELYKLNEKSQAFIAKANFLDEIIKQEFKNIENKINNKEISCVEDLIHENNFDERIYLPSCKEKISKFISLSLNLFCSINFFIFFAIFLKISVGTASPILCLIFISSFFESFSIIQLLLLPYLPSVSLKVRSFCF